MKPAVALAFDLVFLLLALALVGPPLALVAWLVPMLGLPAPLAWGLAPVWYLVAVKLMLLLTGALRLCLPRLRPGTHAFPGSPQALAWLAHFALMRVASLPLWQPVVYSFASLRWLWLRALGAEAAFGIQTATDVRIVDPSLFAVGPGSMLAAGTFVAGHFVEHDRLLLAPVRLAEGVQVMGQVSLSPGTTVGPHAVIGPGSKLLPHVRVGEDAFLGLGCLLHEGVVVGANAVVGHQATLEAGVVLAEGAVVRPFARVPKGTVVPAGGKYPPAKEGDA